MTQTFVRSEQSPGVLEVRPSVPVSELDLNFSAEVPDGWVVVFSAQKGTLTLAPSGAASVQGP